MAFDKNQQDQFNMNNGIDQVKQFQAELDRATASIGAAELAAEEEQLNTKLQNLSTIQKARQKQLEKLSDLEEAGILELAKLRQTLSEKQFKAKKKDIERELKLAKEAANTLAKTDNSKKPTKDTSSAKGTSKANTIKDIAVAASKQQAPKQPSKTDSQSALLEINKTLNAVDGKLTELQNSVKAIRIQLGKDLQALTSSQVETAQAVQNLATITPTASAEPIKVDSNTETAQPHVVPEVKVEPNIVVEPTPVTVEPNIVLEPATVVIEPDITVEPAPVNIEQAPIVVEPNIVVESTQVTVEPNIIVEPTPISVEPNITVEPTPVAVEAPNVVVEYTPTASESAPIVVEPSIIVEPVLPQITVEPTPINIEPVPVIVEQNITVEPTEVTPNIEVEPANVIVEPEILVEPAINVEPTPIIIEQGPSIPAVGTIDLTENLIQAAAGVEEELVATKEALSTTNGLLQGLIKVSTITQNGQEQTEQKGSENSIDSLKESGTGSQKTSTTKDLAAAQDTKGGGGVKGSEQTSTKQNSQGADGVPPRAPSTKQEGESPNKAENNFTDKSDGLKKEKLGEKTLEDLINGLQTNFKYLQTLAVPDKKDPTKTVNPTLELLNSIIKKGKQDQQASKEATEKGAPQPELQLSQATLDIAGAWLESIEEAAQAEEELAEFKKDLAINTQLIQLDEETKQRKAIAAKERSLLEENARAKSQLDFTAANRDRLLAVRKQEEEKKLINEYKEYLLEAGEYAVSLEEYKKDQARKDNAAAKKKAVGGITDGLKKFGTGEFSMTDLKKSYGEYMGQRTAELNTFDREAREAELRKQNPGLSDDDLQKQLDAESDKAEASAKVSAQFEMLAEAAGGLTAALEADVKKIAEMQGFVDTRLQGSKDNEQKGLSYWKQLLKDAKSIAGASPFIRQEKLVENIKTLVDKGISFDIKQRAFLMTIQEKVASTFDAADGTLLRLIRIQQQDTTAGRLGMESALNSFLNSMYETSEYLESVAKSVRGSLEEMQALMEGKDAAELEFQVQKWMGSLYSVGMSDSAVQSIAQTFGQIASGDVSGLTGNGTGNLLIMAANEAGLSIADILQDGLKADETNKLMQAMVNYLAEIAESSSDSKVVQQQLANVYGIKASDLRAATNLSTSVKDVAKTDKTYFDMMLQLNNMMNTIRFRTSISEGMTNMWDNVQYSMASTQASNPILYALPKMAKLLKDVTGSGIALPFANVMGFGIDLNTNVADLMLVASMAGTALGALGPLITGITDLVNPLAGTTMLMRAGINPLEGGLRVLARGTPATLQNTSGASTSESGSLVGNGSGDDIKNATLQDAEDSKKQQMVEAKEEESSDDVVIKSQQAIIDIYNLLEEVAHGSQSLRVKVVNSINCGCGPANNYQNIENESDGTTAAGTGVGKYGNDNGNWVLSF